MRRVVIVGASLAGVNAVDGLRDAGFDGQILLVGEEALAPYDRPPLSKAALAGKGGEAFPVPLRSTEWYQEREVEGLFGRAAVGVDPVERAVEIGGEGRVGYDGLVIATGSRPRRLQAGGEAPTVAVLRTAGDCVRIAERLASARRLVVVGAGFVGLEVAATAREMGLDVTVVEWAPVPLGRAFGDEVGGWFAEHHARHGVRIHCATQVAEVRRRSRGSEVVLTDGTVLQADLVVAGVGAVPAIDWLRGSGLQLTDGVVCDRWLRTSAPGVVAAGDVARWYHPLFDEVIRVEQWTNALEQGRYAAQSLLGVCDGPYDGVPYFWSDQFDARIRFVGRANAAEHVRVEQADDGQLVVLYGRDALLRGALCVNAPRRLAVYRQAIAERVPWEDAVEV